MAPGELASGCAKFLSQLRRLLGMASEQDPQTDSTDGQEDGHSLTVSEILI
jgi:hypothetical protein